MKIKKFIKDHCIDYRDVAKHLKKHPKFINGVLNGRIKPGPKLSIKLVNMLNKLVEHKNLDPKQLVTKKELRPDLWD